MATFKRIMTLVCVVCLLAVVAMLAVGCDDKTPTEPSTTVKPTVGSTSYTVTVRTAGGIRLDDVTVYVRKSATDNDLVDVPKKLDANGQYVFTAPTSSEYVVELEGVPAGYDVQAQYPVTGAAVDILLTSAPIQGEVPAGTIYSPGDIIHDYSFTDIDGVQRKISDILKEKNALVLNFWYVNCSFCIKEFPHLQEAYAMHSDNVEVLALDVEDDSESEIRKVFRDLGLTFPVAKTSGSLLTAMKGSGCPTTVVIDRYGMISFVYSGDLTPEPAAFRALMRYFGAEDYQQGVVEGTFEALDRLIVPEDIPYGCEKYPYDVGALTEYVGEVRADEPVYYRLYRSATLRIEDPDVYLEMNGEKYYPENGVLELDIRVEEMFTGVTFVLRTKGGEDKEVILKQVPQQGSSENPFVLTLGELTFLVNNQDAYYTFTSEYTGTFTITVDALPEGVSCRANMTNMRTYVVTDTSSDDAMDPETGKVTFSIQVEAGDTVRIIFGVYSENPTHTQIQALASIPEVEGIGPSYSVSVRDESGTPMAGVELTVTVGGQPMSGITGEDGVAYLELKEGTYLVKLKLPEGYYATEEYLLTPANCKLEIVLVAERQYTVQVSLTGGVLAENVIVKIYTSSICDQLVCSGVLDENGQYTFGYGYLDSGVVVLEGLPGTVYVQSSYPLTGDVTEIQLVSTSIGDTNAANQDYQLGDKVHDFSVTTPDGRVFSLYELLQQKRAVVLSFWHIGSAPALADFQSLETAYQTYGDRIELLAMNPMDKSDADIAAFQGKNDFSFPMAQCSTEWESAFHLTVYPSLVIIDRDGTICLIHSGAVNDAAVMDAVLAHYTAENYETTVVSNIEQLLPQQGQPDGTLEDPFVVEQGTTELTVQLEAGESAYYTFWELEPLQIRIEGENAYVIYNGETIATVDGVLELVINTTDSQEQQTLQIGNAGVEAVTLQITLTVLAAG